MKKSIFILAILLSISATAQKFKVNYTYYFNEPTKVSKQKIYLDILAMEGITIGAGVHGFYSPIKLITLNGLFRYQYLDFITKSADKASTNSVKSSFHGEASAQIQFAGYTRKKEKRTGVILSGNMTSKTTLSVKAKVYRGYSARGGLMVYRTPIIGRDSQFISNGQYVWDKDKPLYSNQTGTAFFVGYSGKKVRKVGVDADGYGKRKSYLSRIFFADLIMGGTVLSDVVYNGTKYDIKDTKRDNTGYRLGWEWDENGTITRFEVGKRPGYNAQSIIPLNYFLLSFAFTIYGGEKFMEKEKPN